MLLLTSYDNGKLVLLSNLHCISHKFILITIVLHVRYDSNSTRAGDY